MGNKKVMMIAILTMYVFILGACGSQKETDSTKVENNTNTTEKTSEDKQVTDEKQSSNKETEVTTEETVEEQKETPIVQKVGEVDEAEFVKVETAFTDIVKKMREDKLINDNDICVIMDSASIKVDITFENTTTDIILSKDESTGVFTLALDHGFMWLEGLSESINDIDLALYNKELLLALLSVVSAEPQTIFDTIDQTYFSSFYISDTEWTTVGDCQMMDGADSIEGAYSYKIKK